MSAMFPRRHTVVLPLIALLALAACGRSDRSHLNSDLRDIEDNLPSCAADGCVEEVATLAAALAKLPGVVRVVEPTYREEQITDGADVAGELVVRPGVECTSTTLREQAAELGWTSSVSPLMSINFQCRTERPDDVRQDAGLLFALVRPTSREQLEQWGDRGALRPPG